MTSRPVPTAVSATTRRRYAIIRFWVYLGTTSLLVLYFLYLTGTALLNEHYRNAPGTQTVTATVTATKRDCTKSGCYFDSYGNYSIFGTQEQSVKVVSLAAQPVTGNVAVLVNPKRPDVAMPYYSDPYPGQAILGASLTGAFLIWNGFLYWLYRHAQKKSAITQMSPS